MNASSSKLGAICSFVLLASCSSHPQVFVSNGSFALLPKREGVGPRGAVVTSPILHHEKMKFSWRTKVGSLPVTNGYSNCYSIKLRFLKRLNSGELTTFEISEHSAENIQIKYQIRDNSGKVIWKLGSTFSEWRATTIYFKTSGSGNATSPDISYWADFVDIPRIKREREKGNVFFYPIKDSVYTLEVDIDASNVSESWSGIYSQVLLKS